MSDRSKDWLAQAQRDLEHARKDVIDGFYEHAYMATRYPNGFDSGAPMDFYTEEQASDAVRRAERIIRWCEGFPGA